jgi:hypothetical protein
MSVHDRCPQPQSDYLLVYDNILLAYDAKYLFIIISLSHQITGSMQCKQLICSVLFDLKKKVSRSYPIIGETPIQPGNRFRANYMLKQHLHIALFWLIYMPI